jgi:diguanylate cyclase (GGDEF)-like protein
MARDYRPSVKDPRATVLTVEDDDAIRALIGGVLSSEFNMQAAGDAETALALAAENPPDLILLDVGLPDMDGFEACRRFKAHPALTDIPVIFLTSRTSSMDEVDGLEAGGIDYITKPINPAILRARIRNHLELKRSRDALERMARVDGLTGVANRRTFDDMLLREWRRQARTGQPLSVIMIDVDHFKQYNDTYGHGAGDRCLKKVTQAAEDALQRPADIIARYGGEEFVALLPDTTLEGALSVAEGIRTAVVALDIEHTESKAAAHVTVSLGVACMVPETDKEPSVLMEAADGELYAAKSSGRNCIKGIHIEKKS